ncbi:MAG: hypothetical protein IJS22_00695 [Lachnospiraceae bacterium]|nr:hypothetical protein [Lachnospiraceae bacterium]
MRIWVKLFDDAHLLRDTTIEDNSDDTRTAKVLRALESACREFDLGVPIWLRQNVTDFQRHAKVRFNADSFIEPIDFDYLEFQVIEEDL